MLANFHNLDGWMFSMLDFHEYWGVPPVPPPGLPHAAYCSFNPPTDFEHVVLTVTTDGKPVLQKGFEQGYIVHVPPAPPFAGAEVAKLALIYFGSASTPFMSVLRVTAGGAKMATCEVFDSGTNINCADPISLPVGAAYNAGSVVTNVTTADRRAAQLDYAVYVATSWAFEKTLGKLVEPIADGLWGAAVKYAPKGLKDALEGAADGIVKLAKKAVAKDFIKDEAAEAIAETLAKPKDALKDGMEELFDQLRDVLASEAGETAGDLIRDMATKDLPER